MDELAETKKEFSLLVNGLIVWKGAAYRVRIERPFMILDTKAWARMCLTAYEDRFGEDLEEINALDEGEKKNAYLRDAAGVGEVIEDIQAWLDGEAPRVTTTLPLALRMNMSPLQVTKANLDEFVRGILLHDEEWDLSEPIKFLFMADYATPIMYAANSLNPLASCVGSDMIGICKNRKTLQAMVEKAIEDPGFIFKEAKSSEGMNDLLSHCSEGSVLKDGFIAE